MSWAAELIKAQDGDIVIIPLALVRKLGLPAAAFLRQAAYLSAVVERNGGWFFLEQEGPANENGKSIFERYGSWHASLGIGPDAQAAIRKQLRGIHLLEETRKGTVHGKLLYRVDPERYLNFLASCYSPSPTSQTGNPDCANRDPRLSNPDKSNCSIGKNPDDIYQEDLSIQKEAAARAQARVSADAAATPRDKQGQGRRRRGDETVQHGVEIWTSTDAEGLQALVDRYSAERVKKVASGIAPAAGHRAPYLSTVVSAFQALAAAEAREAAEAKKRAEAAERLSRPHKRSPKAESERAKWNSFLGRSR